jgi:hexosaminidase
MRFLLATAAIVSVTVPGLAWANPTLPLLPMPAAVTTQAGSFSFARARIAASDAGASKAAQRLSDLVARSGGSKLALAKNGAVRFIRDPAVKGAEAYRLRVTPAGVTVTASTDAGIYYGATTLWQLIAASKDGRIGAVTIDDAPTFAWRGVMLDSVRHFQPAAYVKTLIDRMAMEKLNVLHWHLTDDQGWRLQIDRYPRLTSVGAWRQPAGAAGVDPKTGQPVRYGGFYTKAEVREIVAYATARHITVVPEIEMPGHATAAIAAYPELGSTATPPKAPYASWGVMNNLYNTKDSTFTFLENVLDEVLPLFPSRYIHVGGDEAVKDQWKADPEAQAKMKALGLKNEERLQGWFVARIGDYLAKRGRRLVGWDEILDGKVPTSATVMSWHGIDGAVTAAKAGHDAILSPSPDFYLDHIQSDSGDEPPGRGGVMDWKHIYTFDVMPGALTAEQRQHLLGVQVNLWTEHVRTTQYADRMMWPRAAVLAELGWTPPAKRDWTGFSARLPAEFARYRALGYSYDQTPLEPLASFNEAGGKVAVTLAQQAGVGSLRYTVDGSAPTAASRIYDGKLALDSGIRLRAQAFAGSVALGSGKDWSIGPALLRTRGTADMELCSASVALRLEDDGLTGSVRKVLWGDILHPCWIWKGARLDGIASLSAQVGQVPFNFSVGADYDKIKFERPRTPTGELQVHDGCSGPLIASIPLGDAVRNSGVSAIVGSIAPMTGRHDLCMTFTQTRPDPLWMLDRLTLEPAG